MKYPMYVDFAITPYCNLHCSFCYAEANGKTKSQRTVSYTHLDVYKRQGSGVSIGK